MNYPISVGQSQQIIIDLVPLLVELGRTAERSLIAAKQLPKPWEFGVLWQQWDRVVSGWESAKVADLIRGLTYFELMFDRGFGSVPPVANLFGIYSSMVDAEERDQFADWILANTVNDYSPFGTHNHGARSLEELARNADARLAQKQAILACEQARSADAQRQRTMQATERLPSALRRKDAKAVAALLAKGADADAVGTSGLSAREVARNLGVEALLVGAIEGSKKETNVLTDERGFIG